MNSLHAVTASKNKNAEQTAQPVHVQHVKFHAMVVRGRLIFALYALCYFLMHLLRADCSFNYFFAKSQNI